MLYEAVQQLTIDSARALRAARRCADLDPVAAEKVTSAWLPRQAGLGWTAAMNLLDKLIVEADRVLAREKELRALAQRGVWVWGLEHGAMNLTGRLDVLDARLLDVRLDQVAELLEDRYPHLNHQQRRAKAIALLAEPARAMALLASEGRPSFRSRPTSRRRDGLSPWNCWCRRRTNRRHRRRKTTSRSPPGPWRPRNHRVPWRSSIPRVRPVIRPDRRVWAEVLPLRSGPRRSTHPGSSTRIGTARG
ncbi:hypothetical protein G7085_18540 [Tessaracoccus sp. HDW20]|uniref:hypothetical protein n=1 Tax=Tessaracoccus coleopterorum TaxID=2714950 RepID=UPI0018D2E053|nr:hypothetical protein [Tessaracoccus coleopterorum]NHB85874.1 hypothetical protein [Tessaracoccus coleopterorum]